MVFLLHLSGQWPPKNVALNKPAYQISTDYGGTASRAVDGRREPDYSKLSCTHTRKEMSPWWMVDLEKNYNIRYVTVTNREKFGKCYVTVEMLSITSQSLSNDNNTFPDDACDCILCFKILANLVLLFLSSDGSSTG